MKVKLVSDGRVFTPEGNDDYEPGDVAWIEEDVLLVTKIEDGVALAIEHPAAAEMMRAALDVDATEAEQREGLDRLMRALRGEAS